MIGKTSKTPENYTKTITQADVNYDGILDQVFVNYKLDGTFNGASWKDGKTVKDKKATSQKLDVTNENGEIYFLADATIYGKLDKMADQFIIDGFIYQGAYDALTRNKNEAGETLRPPYVPDIYVKINESAPFIAANKGLFKEIKKGEFIFYDDIDIDGIKDDTFFFIEDLKGIIKDIFIGFSSPRA